MISHGRAGGSAVRRFPRAAFGAALLIPLAGAAAAADWAATAGGTVPGQFDAPSAADQEGLPPQPRRVSRLISLVGVDTPGDPGATSDSVGDSPTRSSGPFDATRSDLGEDDDLSEQARRRDRQRRVFDKPAAVDKIPDPLTGTPMVSPEQTGKDADAVLAKMLKPRSDSWADWTAPVEPLHWCGEPRALPPCVPPPPCHPSFPPTPYDLVGVQGAASCGPIYGGPCAPRTGTHDAGPHPRLHRLYDRFFDWFYMWK